MDKANANHLVAAFLSTFPPRGCVSIAFPEFLDWLYGKGYEIRSMVTAEEDVAAQPVKDE